MDLFSLFGGFFSFRFYLLRLFETRRSGLVRVCCRGRGRDCITQVRRCLTGRLPTLTNSLYLHRLVVSKETVREVMQNTVNKPNKNSIKKKHGHTHTDRQKKKRMGECTGVCILRVREESVAETAMPNSFLNDVVQLGRGLKSCLILFFDFWLLLLLLSLVELCKRPSRK